MRPQLGVRTHGIIQALACQLCVKVLQAACWWLLCALLHMMSPAVREWRAGSVLVALPPMLSKL